MQTLRAHLTDRTGRRRRRQRRRTRRRRHGKRRDRMRKIRRLIQIQRRVLPPEPFEVVAVDRGRGAAVREILAIVVQRQGAGLRVDVVHDVVERRGLQGGIGMAWRGGWGLRWRW